MVSLLLFFFSILHNVDTVKNLPHFGLTLALGSSPSGVGRQLLPLPRSRGTPRPRRSRRRARRRSARMSRGPRRRAGATSRVDDAGRGCGRRGFNADRGVVVGLGGGNGFAGSTRRGPARLQTGMRIDCLLLFIDLNKCPVPSIPRDGTGRDRDGIFKSWTGFCLRWR